jgi:hypothetical protein
VVAAAGAAADDKQQTGSACHELAHVAVADTNSLEEDATVAVVEEAPPLPHDDEHSYGTQRRNLVAER